MNYSSHEILIIINGCITIDQVYKVCKIFASLIAEGECYNRDLINNLSLRQIKFIENFNSKNL